MIQAYKNIDVEIDRNGTKETVSIPFSVGLMREMEDMYHRIADLPDQPFFRQKKEQKNIHDLYLNFTKKYVEIDDDASPDFGVLFFSSVLASYLDSMKNYSELVEYMTKLGSDSAKNAAKEMDQELEPQTQSSSASSTKDSDSNK